MSVVLGQSDFAVGHSPAAATQATRTIAAGGVGVRHVCTSLTAVFSTGATGGSVGVSLRDGTTGVGTQLWQAQIQLPVSGYWSVALAGLNLVGSPNTAMTLEFFAAGPAASLQSVAFSGYDTN